MMYLISKCLDHYKQYDHELNSLLILHPLYCFFLCQVDVKRLKGTTLIVNKEICGSLCQNN